MDREHRDRYSKCNVFDYVFFILRANTIGTTPHEWIGGSTFDFEDGSEEGEDDNTVGDFSGLSTGSRSVSLS